MLMNIHSLLDCRPMVAINRSLRLLGIDGKLRSLAGRRYDPRENQKEVDHARRQQEQGDDDFAVGLPGRQPCEDQGGRRAEHEEHEEDDDACAPDCPEGFGASTGMCELHLVADAPPISLWRKWDLREGGVGCEFLALALFLREPFDFRLIDPRRQPGSRCGWWRGRSGFGNWMKWLHRHRAAPAMERSPLAPVEPVLAVAGDRDVPLEAIPEP